MMLAGHSLAHFPHPTHLVKSTFAIIPLKIVIADKGHTFTQHPQATQSDLFMDAFFFFIVVITFLLRN